MYKHKKKRKEIFITAMGYKNEAFIWYFFLFEYHLSEISYRKSIVSAKFFSITFFYIFPLDIHIIDDTELFFLHIFPSQTCL